MHLFSQLSKTFFYTDTKIFLSIVGIVLILLSNCMPISAETGGLIKDVKDLQANYETINEKLNLLIKLNTWEKFTNNITDLVKDNAHHHYDYAVFRNNGFRKLTVSEWNSGWRVMTEPYMTGDTEQTYRLGGSMWEWENKYDVNVNGERLKPGHKEHVYHNYYYYFGDKGVIPSGGNEYTVAHEGGEGYFYRKLRGIPESPEVSKIIEKIGGNQ